MTQLIIAAGPAGSGKSTWAQVWRMNDPQNRRVVDEGQRVNGGKRSAAQAIEEISMGRDVCLVLETSADVSVLNFAAEPEVKDVETLRTNLREVESEETA